jgi:hypothetical protein
MQSTMASTLSAKAVTTRSAPSRRRAVAVRASSEPPPPGLALPANVMGSFIASAVGSFTNREDVSVERTESGGSSTVTITVGRATAQWADSTSSYLLPQVSPVVDDGEAQRKAMELEQQLAQARAAEDASARLFLALLLTLAGWRPASTAPPARQKGPDATAAPVDPAKHATATAAQRPQLEALPVRELRQLARTAGHRSLARSGRRQQLLEVLT